jgi:hypothetical protein
MTRRLLFVLVFTSIAAGCSQCGAAPAPSPDVLAETRATLPTDPDDPMWRDLPVHVAPLLLQDLVEPRLMEPSTTQVRVSAVASGDKIAFRLEWDDAEPDDLPMAGHFADACAIQVPVELAADLPAPQMGEPDRTVEITYWRASWQAVVDGRGDSIRDIYPGATVDHYPFEAGSLGLEDDVDEFAVHEPGSADQVAMANRYAPARALGNTMAGPRTSPVEDLLAEGPGSLAPGPPTDSAGMGVRTDTGWAVVLSRRLPNGVQSTGRGQIAFAVWQGSNDESGARKMRTGWVPLVVENNQ